MTAECGSAVCMFTPLHAEAPMGPLTSPFDESAPSPLAQLAVTALQEELRGTHVGEVATEALWQATGGKMFGVLVARDASGAVGFIKAFSGMLAGRWSVAGFVPPLFDLAARQECEREGDAQVRTLSARCAAIASAPERVAAQAAVTAFAEERAATVAALRERHRLRKSERKAQRAQLTDHVALDRESAHDSGERDRTEAALAQRAAGLATELARHDRKLRAAERVKRMYCAAFMRRIHDTYCVRNAQGEARALRELFAPQEPASGAGDCAAPKLLAYANAHGYTPLALAEFFWGAPPATGGRLSGVVYPACRNKCGPLLPFMLQGLQVAPAHTFSPPPARDAGLRIVFEDEWLAVIDKPCGLLSVPGRHAAHKDSVLSRLRERYPHASGPLLVHRLDLDTSGLLLAAKTADTHTALQRQFAQREVKKRYTAIVEGKVVGESGTIDFPIRPDIDDRPRQIRDLTYGRQALTEWRVLEREGTRTRVVFFPITGRSHQLRVHAAHPLGLGVPIVGDRLYGHAGARLMLHAEEISFTHPATGARTSFTSPAPF